MSYLTTGNVTLITYNSSIQLRIMSKTETLLNTDDNINIHFHPGYSDTSFLATFDCGTLTPTDPIVFNYPVHNAGGHYDPTTGIYTVPLDGTYEIIFRIRAYEDASVDAWLMVDGEEVSEIDDVNKFSSMEMV